jgi:hypothetical protein
MAQKIEEWSFNKKVIEAAQRERERERENEILKAKW